MEYNKLQVDENEIRHDIAAIAKRIASKDEKKTILSDISNADNGRAIEQPKQQQSTIQTPDQIDGFKPCFFSIYSDSIYSHMLETEGNFICKVNFFDNQSEIDLEMRSVLIDWLVNVHYKFKLQPETLYLCANYLDRFLERYVATRANIQLIGVCCLFIASKYEEIFFPKIKNFLAISGNMYTRDNILSTEASIVQTLGYSFTGPTIYQFLLIYLKLSQEKPEFQCVSYYFSERALLDYQMSSILPSKVAGACLVLASKYIHGVYKWPSILQDQFHYTIDDLLPIAKTLEVGVINTDHGLQAIWGKYTKGALHKASYIVHEIMGDTMAYMRKARR